MRDQTSRTTGMALGAIMVMKTTNAFDRVLSPDDTSPAANVEIWPANLQAISVWERTVISKKPCFLSFLK